MESYLKTLDVSIEDFYREVRDAQDETVDPYLQTFIDCLLASADYDSFYKVMSREGERSITRKASGMKLKKRPNRRRQGRQVGLSQLRRRRYQHDL